MDVIPSEDRGGKRGFWKRHVENWRLSNLSQAQYCRCHGLSPRSFSYWKNRIEASSPEAHALVELSFCSISEETSPNPSSAITIRVGDGYRVEVSRGFDVGVLERVLRLVRRL